MAWNKQAPALLVHETAQRFVKFSGSVRNPRLLLVEPGGRVADDECFFRLDRIFSWRYVRHRSFQGSFLS